MALKRFKIRGTTKQMRSVFIKRGKKMVQIPMTRGVELELNEQEMTFHVHRQSKRGILVITEIEAPPEKPKTVVKKDKVEYKAPEKKEYETPTIKKIEEPKETDNAPKRKKRSYKKKTENTEE